MIPEDINPIKLVLDMIQSQQGLTGDMIEMIKLINERIGSLEMYVRYSISKDPTELNAYLKAKG